ncbi:MAG: maleylpyruvate isomerase family mycothiol-dependent enzyme [Mycolicibacterium aromaticivorans]|nr:maleylpyruvate isomerase family mycothiol-dependent enzyme [Mycolicibacterium aromaticivorans]
MDATTLAAAERDDFADLLHGLSGQQWEAPSLCGHWRVRDVAARVISYLGRGRVEFATTLAEHRFHLDRLNNADVRTCSTWSKEGLADAMGGLVTSKGVASGFGGRIALVECMIHQQDIRRPLQLSRTIPADRLRAALDFTKIAPLIRGGWYTRGVRLIGTDIDWSGGNGPEVRGPGEALLLAMARRPSALVDLAGPGVAILRKRSDRGRN